MKIPIVKLYFLRKNEVPQDIIDKIDSDEDLEALIKDIQIKNGGPNMKQIKEQKEEKDPKEDKGNIKSGAEIVNDFELPDPAKNIKVKTKLTMMDHMKKLRVNNALKCRWGKESRIARIFTDDYPEGRVF